MPQPADAPVKVALSSGQATDVVVVLVTTVVTGTLADGIARAVGAVGAGRGDEGR